VFDRSIRALQVAERARLRRREERLPLNLVYNPQGPALPPAQAGLEADYRRILGERFGIVFNALYAMANMPIQRFGSTLVTKGQFNDYMGAAARRAPRRRTSTGDVPVAGFGRLARFPLRLRLQPDAGPAAARGGGATGLQLSDWLGRDLAGNPIAVRDHCYGCTAGQGSSCGGALG
jgi:hypothetical protein